MRTLIKSILRYLLSTSLIIGLFSSCVTPVNTEEEMLDYRVFESYDDFIETLTFLANIENDSDRMARIDALWDSLIVNEQIPFIFDESVALLYRSDRGEVSWAGDFNGWNPDAWNGQKLGLSNVYIYEATFPLDARLDYKIVEQGKWKLDPNNQNVQYSGWGPNSELQMPAWQEAQETIVRDDIPKGDLSSNIVVQSTNLNYAIQYKVYTPNNYSELTDLPVIYVTDGHEYADQKLGAMITVLDNLINDGIIEPVIAVFIDPRNPDNLGENRRADQYRGNTKFIDFVADELTAIIDSGYKTSTTADDRAILGTSYGGLNSGYFGLKRSDKFHLIGIHSPAFTDGIITEYRNSEKLPLKVFMHTGVIFDTQNQALSMKSVMEDKGYPLEYLEVNQGHSWGNWRGVLKQPLVYFFGND